MNIIACAWSYLIWCDASMCRSLEKSGFGSALGRRQNAKAEDEDEGKRALALCGALLATKNCCI